MGRNRFGMVWRGRLMSVVMVVVALVVTGAIGLAVAAQIRARQTGKTRAELLQGIAERERAHRRAPSDAGTIVAYATGLYQAGEFWRARDLVVPAAEEAAASGSVLELAARLEYLTGRYDAAERLNDRLIAATAGNRRQRAMPQVAQLLVHYQRDRFDRIAALDFPSGVDLPNHTLAKAFAKAPYRLEWPAEPRTAAVPFQSLDPLPQLGIEVNGVPLSALFDTGGDMLIVDEEEAKALGVREVTSAMGTFGGGLESRIGFAKVDRVTLGGVTLFDVPIMTMATKRFTFHQAYPVGAIVGTAFMRQFLGTVDYRNRRLVLRERTTEQAAAVRRELAGRLAAEIPFVVDATHMMYARGSLDGKEGLTFFVDSGLEFEGARLSAPIQTLRYVGIPVPETKIKEGSVGGAGGNYPLGIFPIRSISLGPLRQENVSGEYGSRAPASYWASGFISDGLLSHGFLKQYASWTIDFDSMTFLFEESGP